MPSVYEHDELVQGRVETTAPVTIRYDNQPWEAKLLVWVPAANTKCRLARQGAGWGSNDIWFLNTSNSSGRNGALGLWIANDPNGDTFYHSTPPPVQQWIDVHWGWNGTQAFIGWDGANYEYRDSATFTIGTGNNEVGLLDSVGTGYSSNGYQVSDYRVWINNQAIYMRFPCDEGAGLVWEETENGWDGEITEEGIHVEAQPGYPEAGPPAFGDFGPVATSDDSQVTAWQWEESANNADWQNIGTILTNTSGATTNTLTINGASLAVSGTWVRCKAVGDAFTDGIFSDSAQLTVEAAA